MSIIEVTKAAVQHISNMTGVDDLEEVEEFLSFAISMCNMRDSVPSQAADGVGELVRAAKGLLQFRARILTVCLPQRELTAQLAGIFHELAMAVQKVQQGSASEPSKLEK